MESGCWSWEQKTLTSELIQGMELTKKLRVELSSTRVSNENREALVQGILSSYEKALLMLRWSQPLQTQTEGATSGAAAGSPVSSPNGSPPCDNFDSSLKDHQDLKDGSSKKRKMLPRWTEQVRVNIETGLEGPNEDGYSWRKYGQKDILGARYPRSYYRCTFRNSQKCWATKQVQRSDEDPSVFEIIYRGKHTCSHNSNQVPPLQIEEQKQNHDDHHRQEQSQNTLLSYPTILTVDTKNLENNERPLFYFPSTSFGCMEIENHGVSLSALDTNTLLGSFSQSHISPTTPESNYFSTPLSQRIGGFHNVQCSESDITEIFSANTSSSNSPILDLDFSLDSVQIDPNFPFDTPGFFS